MAESLLTVQQFADTAGISKQAVYKAMNNKLKPFVQLVDGKKMLQNKALCEIYGIEVDKREGQPGDNQSQPFEALIAMLQKELEAKNAQLEAKDRQIEQLTTALENTTSSLQAAQVLHAGTMQKQSLLEDGKRKKWQFWKKDKE